ncbi:MAG: hypothetical protein ACYDBQ_06945 [Thermoplasmatota archaeon]
MQPKSGLAAASGILLLIGAILAAVGALFLLGFGILFAFVPSTVTMQAGSGPAPFPFWIFGILYPIMGVLDGVGAILGFIAYGKTRRGEYAAAFVPGLVGAVIMPLNVISLLGAIFARVCPEAQAPKTPGA